MFFKNLNKLDEAHVQKFCTVSNAHYKLDFKENTKEKAWWD